MSIDVFHRPSGRVPDLRDLREVSRDAALARGRAAFTRLIRFSAGLDAVLWAVAIYLRLVLADLISWFAAEPRRIRAAVLGILTCVAFGAAIGAAAGVVVLRIANVLLEIFRNP